MFQCSFPVPLTFVRFEDKIKFSASQDLALARSKWRKPTDRLNRGNVQCVRPPDFSTRLYKNLEGPPSEDQKMLSSQAEPQQMNETQTVVHAVLQSWYRKKETQKFIACYRPPDTLEIEQRFVRTGKLPAAPYKNPKPHDFRPVSFGKQYLFHFVCYKYK